MQRIIQRAARASRRAGRRREEKNQHMRNAESWERNQNRLQLARSSASNIVEARKTRQVDFETGPIAPRRDVGDKALSYGTISMYQMHLPEKDPEKRLKYMHIAEGDRVVVTQGREKGRIGTVNNVSTERDSVQVKGINTVDVVIPDWVQREEGDTRKIVPAAQHVPIEHVKLVYPLPDPETGVPRDTIIDRLVMVNRQWNKDKRKWELGDRLIPGTRTIIPWPEKAEREYEDNEEDTLRITVEEQTFRPFLLHPPMPTSVIDELRGKYSVYRTRHDWDYVRKKELEEEKLEKRKQLGRTMRTPLQELAERREAEKVSRQKDLTEEQLAKIGEVIAQERQKTQSAVKKMAAQ